MNIDYKSLYREMAKQVQPLGIQDFQLYDENGFRVMPTGELPTQLDTSLLSELRNKKIFIAPSQDTVSSCLIALQYKGSLLGIACYVDETDTIIASSKYVASILDMIIDRFFTVFMKKPDELSLQTFLEEWIYSNPSDRDERAFHMQAAVNGIDISAQRIVCLIWYEEEILEKFFVDNYLRRGEYSLLQDNHTVLIIGLINNALTERLQRSCIGKNYIICASDPAIDVHSAYTAVFERLSLCKKLKLYNKVIFADGLILERAIMSVADMPEILSVKSMFSQDALGEELCTTIRVLFESSSRQDACQLLAVHRNTLLYRLDRIKQLTGYDPNSHKDLFILYCAARS